MGRMPVLTLPTRFYAFVGIDVHFPWATVPTYSSAVHWEKFTSAGRDRVNGSLHISKIVFSFPGGIWPTVGRRPMI
jgi:hypothetical protein